VGQLIISRGPLRLTPLFLQHPTAITNFAYTVCCGLFFLTPAITIFPSLTKASSYRFDLFDIRFNSEEAYLFFKFVSQRYERHSTIITSNKSFGDWQELFGDAVIAAAILDILLHPCKVINIKGYSYRLKTSKSINHRFIKQAKRWITVKIINLGWYTLSFPLTDMAIDSKMVTSACKTCHFFIELLWFFPEW